MSQFSYANATSYPNGAALPFRNASAGATGSVVKAGAGRLYSITIENMDTGPVYVKLYDKATAPDENDTPALNIVVPNGTARSFALNAGIQFQSGISFRATTGAADNDTGAPTASKVVVNGAYA